MTAHPRQQPNVDEEQLRVLSVLYFVYGGLAAFFSLLAVAFLIVGTAMGARGAAGWMSPQADAAAAFLGCLFAAIGSALFVLFGITAVIRILTGFALRAHRYYVLCLVVAGISCFEIPIGAVLGVATLVVLLRPSVERLFSGLSPSPSPSPPSPPAVAPPAA